MNKLKKSGKAKDDGRSAGGWTPVSPDFTLFYGIRRWDAAGV
jgi:hypothetical protein